MVVGWSIGEEGAGKSGKEENYLVYRFVKYSKSVFSVFFASRHFLSSTSSSLKGDANTSSHDDDDELQEGAEGGGQEQRGRLHKASVRERTPLGKKEKKVTVETTYHQTNPPSRSTTPSTNYFGEHARHYQITRQTNQPVSDYKKI